MDNAHLIQRSLRLATFMLAGIFIFLCVQVSNAGNSNRVLDVSENGGAGVAASREEVEQIVVAKLEFYSAHYPDINFVVLDTAGEVSRNMHALSEIIGQNPVPLDYEHPKELRQELLMVTLMRIEILLQTDVGSATLFKPDAGALAKRQKVCVITINPWAISADDRAATRHLLELENEEFNAIHPEIYLDHVSHLKFALDHEIYHCLDAAYNGPVPISHRKYWGDYYYFKDESGADAFGILMNIAEHGSRTAYARTLMNIRGLALLCGDVGHYTYRSIGAALQIDPATLTNKDVRGIFRVASQLRDRVVGSYEDYVRYANAAYHAMKLLGVEPEAEQSSKVEPDKKMVKALVRSTKDAYRSLIGRALPGHLDSRQ